VRGFGIPWAFQPREQVQKQGTAILFSGKIKSKKSQQSSGLSPHGIPAGATNGDDPFFLNQKDKKTHVNALLSILFLF
jgi:hypothetical protein